jgi:hypothetical protein
LPGDVVAKVNNYSITAEELEREIAAAWPVLQNYPNIPFAELKAKVLDSMIVKQLLIEEAQNLNVDKEPAFMRRIESDWREALLKSVLAKKDVEFFKKVAVTEAGLRGLYLRETEDLEMDLVTLSDEAAARELSSVSGDDFEGSVTKLGTKVIAHPGPSWWSAGDLPEVVEAKLWSLPAGKISPPVFTPDGGWFVAKVLQRKKVNPMPFEEMRDALQKRIVRETLPQMTDRWIGELRARAKIVTNPQAGEKIKPGTVARAGGNNDK